MKIEVSKRVYSDFEKHCNDNNLDVIKTLNKLMREFVVDEFKMKPPPPPPKIEEPIIEEKIEVEEPVVEEPPIIEEPKKVKKRNERRQDLYGE